MTMFKSIFNYFKTMQSSKLIKGLELTVMGTISAALVSTISAGAFPLTIAALTPAFKTGITAGVVYLLHSVPGTISQPTQAQPEHIIIPPSESTTHPPIK